MHIFSIIYKIIIIHQKSLSVTRCKLEGRRKYGSFRVDMNAVAVVVPPVVPKRGVRCAKGKGSRDVAASVVAVVVGEEKELLGLEMEGKAAFMSVSG